MKYITIPEGAETLMLAFNGEMSKMDDEQREAWDSLNEAAKSVLAQRLDEEKTMEKTEIVEVEVEKDDIDIDKHLVDAVKEEHGITSSIRYTQETLAAEFKRVFFDEIMALRNAGQKEYAHDEDSPFANFERGAEDMDIDRKQVLWCYAMKHKDGIAAALKGHTSQREDVRGRINDLIVYLLLLRGMYNEEFGDTGNFGLGDLEEK